MSVQAVPRSRPRLTRRAAGLAAIVLLLALALVFPIRQFAAQRAEIREMERQVAELVREREALAAKVAQLRDPEYLERVARQCLGMVRPGEIAFITVPEDGGPPVEGC